MFSYDFLSAVFIAALFADSVVTVVRILRRGK
jgi:hypothetical protein